MPLTKEAYLLALQETINRYKERRNLIQWLQPHYCPLCIQARYRCEWCAHNILLPEDDRKAYICVNNFDHKFPIVPEKWTEEDTSFVNWRIEFLTNLYNRINELSPNDPTFLGESK